MAGRHRRLGSHHSRSRGHMDPHGPIAQRFPLVARFRSACLPLHERVRSLVKLADTAVKNRNQELASAV
ncbi:hypothetical protein AB0D11_46010 [Streptomyces monashensis]|uniref:hypothetical protein n=1 Tax=Streptomyces monashensis TaxID=1678012 RepID=UPI0034107990